MIDSRIMVCTENVHTTEHDSYNNKNNGVYIYIYIYIETKNFINVSEIKHFSRVKDNRQI